MNLDLHMFLSTLAISQATALTIRFTYMQVWHCKMFMNHWKAIKVSQTIMFFINYAYIVRCLIFTRLLNTFKIESFREWLIGGRDLSIGYPGTHFGDKNGHELREI